MSVAGHKSVSLVAKGSKTVYSEGFAVVRDGDPAKINRPGPAGEEKKRQIRNQGASTGTSSTGTGSGGGQSQYIGGYKSSDDAARAALNHANPQSIKNNVEYGGNIYKEPGGTYGYSAPRRGTATGFQPNPSDIPKGSTLVGDYHTHGDYSIIDKQGNIFRSTKASDMFNSDQFSSQDKVGISNDARNRVGYTGYLGTPSGTFRKFDPKSGADVVF